MPAGQQSETVPEMTEDLGRGQRNELRRGQFDRERKPVEAPGDLDHGGGVTRDDVTRARRHRALDEQPHAR